MAASLGLLLFSAVLISLAVVRYRNGSENEQPDSIVIGLFVAALLIHWIPLNKLTSFKFGAFEFALQEPQVRGAIDSFSADDLVNKNLREELERLEKDLPIIVGSKVLWIDDDPSTVLTARRVLRSLGVNIISVPSSEEATSILCGDRELDLIITDTHRSGNSHESHGGNIYHEGVNFIVKIRETGDAIIQSIPVVFFSAFDLDDLVAHTKPARDTKPTPEISNDLEDLISKVIRRLSTIRRSPIEIGDKNPKTASSFGRDCIVLCDTNCNGDEEG